MSETTIDALEKEWDDLGADLDTASDALKASDKEFKRIQSKRDRVASRMRLLRVKATRSK